MYFVWKLFIIKVYQKKKIFALSAQMLLLSNKRSINVHIAFHILIKNVQNFFAYVFSIKAIFTTQNYKIFNQSSVILK
jgi:hypothetical protein